MPVLTPLKNDEADPAAQTTLRSLEGKLGRVPNMYRTIAHASGILDAAVSMAQAIRRGLNPEIRELAYLKVADLTNCHVCRHYHESFGRTVGLTDHQIHELGEFEKSNAYTDEEKDILRFTEQWTRVGQVTEEVMNRLQATFSPEELVILSAVVSQANFTCRFNNVFRVELP